MNILPVINSPKKAIALLSGGLDSLLAAKLILDQGIIVEGINFYSGFFGEGSNIRSCSTEGSAKKVADQLKIPLHVINIFEEFQNVLAAPKHGYGANLNPCLDCKINIVRFAKRFMEQQGFDFIISGEVVGQRPMSQRKDTLFIVRNQSEAHDLLLRPLSAKLLPPTLPEREKWVDRERLGSINGRSRKPQIDLAKRFGFQVFPQPAGGCLLTDPRFCDRLNDLWKAKKTKTYSLDEIDLLKIGRHLRLNPQLKIIIGRDHAENEILKRYSEKYTHIYCSHIPGPFVLVDGIASPEDLLFSAQITVYFSKKTIKEVPVYIAPINQKPYTIIVKLQDENRSYENLYI